MLLLNNDCFKDHSVSNRFGYVSEKEVPLIQLILTFHTKNITTLFREVYNGESKVDIIRPFNTLNSSLFQNIKVD